MQHNDPFLSNESLRPGERKQIAATIASVRNAGVTMIVAAAVLLVFNSTGLQSWTRNLDGNTMTDRWVAETDSWHEAMRRLGFAAPKAAVQTAVFEVREWAWSGNVDETDVAEFDMDDVEE